MNKKDILKLFKKYSFDSSIKEPFLYEDKDKLGIYYTFKDEIYGSLNRVFLPNDLIDCEWFLKNYYAYQNSHCNLIKLASYNDPYARPEFIDNIELLDENIVVNCFDDEPYYRSAKMLIKIIKEKMDLSLLTYENVKKLTEKYTRIKQELAKKRKSPEELISVYNPKQIEKIKIKQDNIVKELNNKLKNCQTKEELKKIIDELINYLKSLELEDSLINNKYFMLKIPIEIEQLKEEIKLYDEYNIVKLKKKRKIELEEKIKELEIKHAKNKVISLATFMKKEMQNINEKYNLVSDIDYNTIADYLIEFDNLNIKDSIDIKEKQGIKILRDAFDKLEEQDKNNLYLITFFSNIIDSYNPYIIKEYYKTINNPNNVLVKIKLFKDIDISSYKNFELSIKELINKYNNFNKLNMPCDMLMFFEGNKVLTTNLLVASSKKNCMPKLDSNNPCTYVINLKKNALINYVPSKLTIDITNEDKIVLKEGNPLFIIDIEKNNTINKKDDIIKVAKVKIFEKKTTDIIIVSKIKTEEIKCYKRIEIERNESNG